MRTKIVLITIVAISLLVTGIAMAGIKNSKHDLSSGSTTGTQKSDGTANGTDQLCVFCHTPHFAGSAFNPLWNKNASTATYATYGATVFGTANVGSGNLSGVTKACLSCHDGVNGINVLINLGGAAKNISISGVTTAVAIATAGNLGSDLTNDHPVSITYNASAASLRALTGGANATVKMLANATAGTDSPTGTGGKVECSSCHDPHGTGNNYFLRATTAQSNICLVCHNK